VSKTGGRRDVLWKKYFLERSRPRAAGRSGKFISYYHMQFFGAFGTCFWKNILGGGLIVES
jgi:hypothetical protein